MLDQLLTATIVYPLIIILFVGAAGVSGRFGRRFRGTARTPGDMTTLTAAALGLLALLIAFSLSHALSRYETRRALIVEEANAIVSTANLASMLPPQAQPAILNLLREYLAVRIGPGRPYDPVKLHHDVTNSRELLAKLWQHAVAVSEPQSLPADRFINSLAEMTRVQERRLASMRYNVPNAVLLTLLGLGAVALGFTGYQAGLTHSHVDFPALIMSVAIAIVIGLVIDLDQPARGFIQVPTQAVVDVAREMR